MIRAIIAVFQGAIAGMIGMFLAEKTADVATDERTRSAGRSCEARLGKPGSGEAGRCGPRSSAPAPGRHARCPRATGFAQRPPEPSCRSSGCQTCCCGQARRSTRGQARCETCSQCTPEPPCRPLCPSGQARRGEACGQTSGQCATKPSRCSGTQPPGTGDRLQDPRRRTTGPQARSACLSPCSR